MQESLFKVNPSCPLESLGIPLELQNEICGIDEAGRGCVAGSLFVCGVILKIKIPQKLLESLNDSKVLSAKRREILADELKKYCAFYIVKKSVSEIDKSGLSACLKEALREIVESLAASFYVFDGNCNFGIPHLKTLIKGDSKLKAISAASILAKVAKDAEMRELDKIYPQYKFAKNKGYGSAAHIEAIRQFGLCKAHRKSYKIKRLNA